jgi:hypothetical protein
MSAHPPGWWAEILSIWSIKSRVFGSPQVLRGVAYLHEKMIVHRDLTPRNIMVKPSGHALVIDLGLAVDLAAEDGDAHGKLLGSPVGAVGTMGYIPPESMRNEKVRRPPHGERFPFRSPRAPSTPPARGAHSLEPPFASAHARVTPPPGRQITTAVDMWSVGVVLYEAVFGFAPFAPHEVMSGNAVEFPDPAWGPSSDEMQDLVSQVPPPPLLRSPSAPHPPLRSAPPPAPALPSARSLSRPSCVPLAILPPFLSPRGVAHAPPSCAVSRAAPLTAGRAAAVQGRRRPLRGPGRPRPRLVPPRRRRRRRPRAAAGLGGRGGRGGGAAEGEGRTMSGWSSSSELEPETPPAPPSCGRAAVGFLDDPAGLASPPPLRSARFLDEDPPPRQGPSKGGVFDDPPPSAAAQHPRAQPREPAGGGCGGGAQRGQAHPRMAAGPEPAGAGAGRGKGRRECVLQLGGEIKCDPAAAAAGPDAGEASNVVFVARILSRTNAA